MTYGPSIRLCGNRDFSETILKKIYIAPDFRAHSGVSAYARNFFEHVLEPLGFEHRVFDSPAEFDAWYGAGDPADRFHVEIAVGTHTERQILLSLLRRGAVVDITLHDPPYLAFPWYRSANRVVNQISKLAQIALPQTLFGQKWAQRIRRIYVLSQAGCRRTRKAYPAATVRYLPFICVRKPSPAAPQELALVYTGFIGKKKGLDYALQLHRALLTDFPDLVFKVVGEPVDPVTRSYFHGLQHDYRDHVEYLGYVDEAEFVHLLSAGHVVLLPTKDYGTICPVSANILDALTLGSVVITTRANANHEFVDDGRNGRLFSGTLIQDVEMVASLLREPSLRHRLITAAQARLAREHSPAQVLDAMRT